MSQRLYEIIFAGGWILGEPRDVAGNEVDARVFTDGQRVVDGRIFKYYDDGGDWFQLPDVLQLPIREPGPPLEFSFADGEMIVVSERVGELLDELAPYDIQRLPARVESVEERYEVLNVLTEIDLVDRERTIGKLHEKNETKTGSLNSLTPFLRWGEGLVRVAWYDDLRLSVDGMGPRRILRIKGWGSWPVVTEDIKAALEQAGVTGLNYRQLG